MSGDEGHVESPSVRVVQAVADANGVDPSELDPLSGRLDLESMDEFLTNSSEPVRIECSLGEFRVEVRSDGDVRLSSTSTEP